MSRELTADERHLLAVHRMLMETDPIGAANLREFARFWAERGDAERAELELARDEQTDEVMN